MNVICVIGAGAAGCSAAIYAARAGAEVILLEADSSPAEKILRTGNGHCNFTNLDLSGKYYYSGAMLADSVILRYSAADAIAFFESLGVKAMHNGGYVYPRSNEAKTIRDALLAELKKLNIKLHTNAGAAEIRKSSAGFEIDTGTFTYKADKIIAAAGGLVDGDGRIYDILRGLGHSISILHPALCGLTAEDALNEAAGVRCFASIKLIIDDKVCAKETGELQLTDYGVSGIPVFQLSGRALLALAERRSVKLSIDFLPELSEDNTAAYISGFGVSGLVPSKLAGLFNRGRIGSLKNHEITINGSRGFEYAQLTGGGVATDQICTETLESRIVPGLYFCGELLDVDGRCGGYNLHFAWGSGAIAGCAAAGDKYRPLTEKKRIEITESCPEYSKS